ncbi:hypothetical protein GCM10007973_32220 [Polymorphobacter multimanifer]|nr:histidine kinase [Polymorphobacter multimanifer]GGI93475.1 hypothetical protein GCM10007973_32220 [Polymorphobacter multimanifer]
MRRLMALGLAFVALLAAGFVWTRDRPVAVAQTSLPPAAEEEADAPPMKAPRAEITPEQRELRRFDRYDKDRDERISRDEYLANRRKAFARADANGDGRLDFEEFAVVTSRRFAKADRDGDRALDGREFATTAVKRKPKAACKCEEEG